jgi:hypothetical protein
LSYDEKKYVFLKMRFLKDKLQLKKLFKNTLDRSMMKSESVSLVPKLVEIYAMQWSREHYHLFDIKKYVNDLSIHQSFKDRIFKIHNNAVYDEVYGKELRNYCG